MDEVRRPGVGSLLFPVPHKVAPPDMRLFVVRARTATATPTTRKTIYRYHRHGCHLTRTTVDIATRLAGTGLPLPRTGNAH